MTGNGELSDGLEYLRLKQEARSGARWFWWVAGLSAVNTIAALSGGTWTFMMGLGITQVFDGFGHGLGGPFPVIAGALDLAAIVLFVLIGRFAQREKTAYIIGMVVYALDGLLVLAFRDYMSVAFHVLALAFMAKGFVALGKLQSIPVPHVPLQAAAAPAVVKAQPEPDTGYFDFD
jgi:hypothetical protein